MAFSDTIETTFLTTVYVTRVTQSQDGSGNYDSSVATVAHGLRGDVQPASRWSYRPTDRGADYRVTHAGFFDVHPSVPAEGDTLHDGAAEYAVRNVRDYKDHVELDLERLGV